MAITNLLTSLDDLEGSPSFATNNTRYGGGQGAGNNTDIVRQGSQSGGRRADNTNTGGLGVSFTSTDLSGAGQHIKAWMSITQWSQLNSAGIVIASGSASGAGDIHTVPTLNWPVNFGFIPVWIDVSRTAESGGPATESSINEVGIQVNIGDVGGNAQNIILDQIHYGTSGLRWTSTGPGEWQDFRDYEDTNNIGVFLTQNGIDFCYARVELGDSGGTETDFDDSNFTIAFPDQPLVSTTFMGVTVELQNAGSVITLSDGTIQSSNAASASRKPDFLINGTTGSFTGNSLNLIGMRLIQLTSAATLNGGILDTEELTQGGATLDDTTIQCRAATQVAVLDDPTPVELSDITWNQAGAGHAIEFGASFAGTTVTLTRQFFNGFGGTPGSNPTANSGANDAAIYNNSGGLIDFAIVDGDTPSIRNGASSTSTATNAKTLTFTNVPNGLEGRVRVGSISLYSEASITGNQFEYAYDAADAGKIITVTIGGVADDSNAYDRYKNDFVLGTISQSIPLDLRLNPSYSAT